MINRKIELVIALGCPSKDEST